MDSTYRMPQGDSLRILLLGKTGNGKSATGNTILSGFNEEEVQVFKSTGSSVSVTSTVDKVTRNVSGRSITIVDTPGTCDTSNNDDAVLTEIAGAVEKSTDGYHAFVIVMRYGGRLTEEERQAVEKLERLFGKEIYKFTILIFTHGSDFNRLKRNEKFRESFSEHILRDAGSSNPGAIGPLVKRFGGITVLFDNYEDDPMKRGEMVAELVRKIDEMRARNENKCYDIGIFKFAKKVENELRAKNVPAAEISSRVITATKEEAKSGWGCTIL